MQFFAPDSIQIFWVIFDFLFPHVLLEMVKFWSNFGKFYYFEFWAGKFEEKMVKVRASFGSPVQKEKKTPRDETSRPIPKKASGEWTDVSGGRSQKRIVRILIKVSFARGYIILESIHSAYVLPARVKEEIITHNSSS